MAPRSPNLARKVPNLAPGTVKNEPKLRNYVIKSFSDKSLGFTYSIFVGVLANISPLDNETIRLKNLFADFFCSQIRSLFL